MTQLWDFTLPDYSTQHKTVLDLNIRQAIKHIFPLWIETLKKLTNKNVSSASATKIGKKTKQNKKQLSDLKRRVKWKFWFQTFTIKHFYKEHLFSIVRESRFLHRKIKRWFAFSKERLHRILYFFRFELVCPSFVSCLFIRK